MFVLRIQFIGEKAREIMQDEHAPNPKHVETLRKALNELSIPYPDRVRPVWKSGVIMCHYTADMDSVCTVVSGLVTQFWVSGPGS